MTVPVPVFYIGGNKGGIGKSMFALMLVDHIFRRFPSKKILAVETDLKGFDFVNCFVPKEDDNDKFKDEFTEKYKRIKIVTVDLRKTGGWHSLGNELKKHADHVIVINSAANQLLDVEENAAFFNLVRDKLVLNYISFWLVDKADTGLELLMEYFDKVGSAVVHIVRSLKSGPPEAFGRLLTADEVDKEMKKRSGLILDFPALPKEDLTKLDVADALRGARRPFDEAYATMDFSSQISMEVWRNCFDKEIEKIIAEVLSGTEPVQSAEESHS